MSSGHANVYEIATGGKSNGEPVASKEARRVRRGGRVKHACRKAGRCASPLPYQAVASSAIHDGVRTAGARYGDLTQGRQVAYERWHIALGRLNADQYQAGLTVWSDPTHRAVQGQAQAERTLDVPFLSSATFWVQVGSFQRKWQFYGGPPSGWE